MSVKVADFEHIIVDIEGTVAPITFVHNVLFPYVTDNVREYLERTWSSDSTKNDVAALIAQSQTDIAEGLQDLVPIPSPESTPESELKEAIIANVLWQMSWDRKAGALKQLQGHMWKEAFESGAISSELFDDVPKAFKAIVDAGKKLYVYSSGSVGAQVLLFTYVFRFFVPFNYV